MKKGKEKTVSPFNANAVDEEERSILASYSHVYE